VEHTGSVKYNTLIEDGFILGKMWVNRL
jgi:hypothetical protein